MYTRSNVPAVVTVTAVLVCCGALDAVMTESIQFLPPISLNACAHCKFYVQVLACISIHGMGCSLGRAVWRFVNKDDANWDETARSDDAHS